MGFNSAFGGLKRHLHLKDRFSIISVPENWIELQLLGGIHYKLNRQEVCLSVCLSVCADCHNV